MVCDIRDANGRRLPQFPLRKGQRLKACFSIGQPLLEKGAFVCGHVISGSASERGVLGVQQGHQMVASSPSNPSISSSESASKFTSSVEVSSGIVMRVAAVASAPSALVAPICSAINATIWPIVRARIRLAWRQRHAERAFNRVFDLDAH